MARTTFSGPVVSNAGFITGANAVSASVTAATLTIDDSYNGQTIPLNRAGGITVTLPAATGSQSVYRFVVGTTFTSSGIIKVANSTDVMTGIAAVSNATASSVFGTLNASDTITMNTTTTGGGAGSYVELFDVAAGDWVVKAFIQGAVGSPATPFSATV